MFDLIGDIHGHCDQLEILLNKLGYKKKSGAYFHPERKVLFLGDYINKGPKIKAALEIVKAMTDRGSAIALMGNHEYNAIRAHFGVINEELDIDQTGTLLAFKDHLDEFDHYVEWFKTLPLFYENNYFRAVHACWDPAHIALLREKLSGQALTSVLINTGPELNRALTETLIGKELVLPGSQEMGKGSGTRIRTRWWEDPSEVTYKSFSVDPIDDLPDVSVDLALIKDKNYYGQNEKPVFFGHYGRAKFSTIIRHNVCCLDFGVANGGHLAAYRIHESTTLSNNHLVYV